jgi:hypothetical protein
MTKRTSSTKSRDKGKSKQAAAPEPEPSGYRVVIKPDLSHDVVNADGKVLASVPDKLRQTETWKQWMALRENHRARVKEHARTIASWMVSRRAIPGIQLATLYRDPAWRTVMSALLVRSDRNAGLIVGGEPERGIGLFTRDLDSEWQPGGQWIAPHPIDLGDELPAWQACATAYGQPQGIAQLYRSIHRPTPTEIAERASSRYAGLTLANAAAASHGFNRRGWTTAAGKARREIIVFGEREPLTVTAEFAYFADGDSYGDWNQECTTGSLVFRDAAGEPLKLRDVPAAVFSEICVDVADLVAGAS